MPSFFPGGLAWHRDLPDPQDFGPEHPRVVELLDGLAPADDNGVDAIDWREYCGEPRDHGPFPTSAAHACAALLQYFERRALGELFHPAALFIHQTAERLMRGTDHSGAGLRMTFKAITRFGVPPEQHWRYVPENVLTQPDAFVYSVARTYNDLTYVRLDEPRADGESVLQIVKSYLAAGMASVFGFSVFSSLTRDADIPAPTVYDVVQGGTAALVVGADDNRRTRSASKGALLIRPSWGAEWGDRGYGWLPYDYVRSRLAADFWTVLRPQWLTSGEFSRPAPLLAPQSTEN